MLAAAVVQGNHAAVIRTPLVGAHTPNIAVELARERQLKKPQVELGCLRRFWCSTLWGLADLHRQRLAACARPSEVST